MVRGGDPFSQSACWLDSSPPFGDHPGAMKRAATILITLVLGLGVSGCKLFDLGRYDTLGDWYIGNPGEDYSDLGAEDSFVLWRITYGLVIGIPYLLRDVTKIVMLPIAWPYYELRGDRPEQEPPGS